jgi:putative transport protein
MSYFWDLLYGNSAAQAFFVLSLVSLTGLILGSISYKSFNLGISGVLFTGLFFGYLGLKINPQIMDFIQDFGLVLFVYTIGLQVGPGFFNAFKKNGAKMCFIGTVIVLMGAAISILLAKFAKVPMSVAIGMYTGSTTNTPSFAAALETVSSIYKGSGHFIHEIGTGYAVAFPFGIIGIILIILMFEKMFKIDPRTEAREYRQQQGGSNPLLARSFLVENQTAINKTIKEIGSKIAGKAVISRILHDHKTYVARANSTLQKDDIILAVGTEKDLKFLEEMVGKKSDVNLEQNTNETSYKKIYVTNKNVLGKTLAELELRKKHNVVITRIFRFESELIARPFLELEYGDLLTVVGDTKSLEEAIKIFGDSTSDMDTPRLIPFFIGIFAGIMLGLLPIKIPGVPVSIKLGLSGGSIITSLIFSKIGRIGGLIWKMPKGANLLLREIGIVIFFACVGIKAGPGFMDSLIHGQGFYWMFCSISITFIPLFLAIYFLRKTLKYNFLTLGGLVTGSTTNPPGLTYLNSLADSNAPAIAYVTVYPLMLLLKIVTAQLLIIFFLR